MKLWREWMEGKNPNGCSILRDANIATILFTFGYKQCETKVYVSYILLCFKNSFNLENICKNLFLFIATLKCFI